jgi:hypothetical protein
MEIKIKSKNEKLIKKCLLGVLELQFLIKDGEIARVDRAHLCTLSPLDKDGKFQFHDIAEGGI